MQLWKSIIQQKPECTKIGKLIMADICRLASDVDLNRTLEDVFSMKATNTLIRRASSMVKFIHYAKSRGEDPFPVRENLVYAMMYETAWKSASFSSSLKEALNFSGHILGIEGCIEAAESPRIQGYCNKMKASKVPRGLKAGLTGKQGKRIEMICKSGADLLYRVFAVHCLNVMYARLRWNDAQHVRH